MLRLLQGASLAALLALAPSAPMAGEAGDLVFADRAPWNLGGTALVWRLTREGPAVPGFLPARDGAVTLSEATDPADGRQVLRLVQRTDAGERRIGPFPLSSGDPVVVFFLENTTRDMAALTGGNPDYIRNRIKDAVFRGGTVSRDGGRVVAEMQPFAGDPNAARMGAFAGLRLRFTMDDDPRRPIRELRAETGAEVAPGPPREQPGQAVRPARYVHAMVLE